MRTLVGRGKAVVEIALAVGISEPALRKHYAVELAAPRPQAKLPIAELEEPGHPAPARERSGRPPHVPTAESRERVEILVAGGQRSWQIAAALGISEPTLRQHYGEELQHGRARRNAQVIEALHRAAIEGNVSAARAWLALPTDADEPPAPAEPAPLALGKKAAAQEAAKTAQFGSDWADILPN